MTHHMLPERWPQNLLGHCERKITSLRQYSVMVGADLGAPKLATLVDPTVGVVSKYFWAGVAYMLSFSVQNLLSILISASGELGTAGSQPATAPGPTVSL